MLAYKARGLGIFKVLSDNTKEGIRVFAFAVGARRTYILNNKIYVPHEGILAYKNLR